MPNSTFVEIPEEEPAQMLAALRRARYASLLALHIVVWCAAGLTPTDIAAVLFCSRSSVYRTVRASREGSRGWRSNGDGQLLPPVCRTGLLPMLRRSLLALRKAPPQAYGRCRTCWSGATLALPLQDTRRLTVSAETVRRWGHEVG
jgi:Homeodomain-like domain